MTLPALCALLSAAVGAISPSAPSHAVSWGAFGARATATTARTLNLLVVPMRFAGHDTTFSSDTLDAIFSRAGSTVNVRDYFRQQSKGQLEVAARVLPWSMSSLPRDSCGVGVAAADSCNTRLMREVANHALQAGVDLAKYDNDGDGAVDGLILVFSGKGYEETNSIYDIQSSQFEINQPTALPGGLTVNTYLRLAEVIKSRPTPPGTAAHEIGHVLGLPDLYDQNLTITGHDGGLGAWDLMSHGSHGLGWDPRATGPTGGWFPVGLGAFDRIALGWASPKEIDSAAEVRLAPGEIARLWTDPYRTRQYLLIENRDRSGVDSFLPGPGLLVTRIRPHRVQSYAATCPQDVNSDSADMGVTLLEASGKQRIAKGLDWEPLAEDLYSSAADSLWDDGTVSLRLPDGKPSGAALGSIRLDGTDLVFRANPSVRKGSPLRTTTVPVNSYSVADPPFTLAVPMKMPASGRIRAVQPVVSEHSGTICTEIWKTFTPTGMGAPLYSVCDTGGFHARFKGIWHELEQPIEVAAGERVYVGVRMVSGWFFAASEVDVDVDTCFFFQPGKTWSRIGVRPKIELVLETDSAASTIAKRAFAPGLDLRRVGGKISVRGARSGETVRFVVRNLAGQILSQGSVVCDARGAGVWDAREVTGIVVVEARSPSATKVEMLVEP